MKHEIDRLSVDDTNVQRSALTFIVEFATSRHNQDLVHANGGIDALMKLVVVGKTPDVRANAMRALGLVGAKNGLNKACTRPVLASIVRLVREGSPHERAEAVWALRILTYEDDESMRTIIRLGALRALREAAASDDLDPFYRRAAGFVVRALTGELVPRFDDEEASVATTTATHTTII